MGDVNLYLSKAVALLLLPPGILILLLFAGLFFAKQRCGRFLMGFSAFLLCVLSMEPVSDALLRPLESRYPPLQISDLSSENTAIVLLGGGIDVHAPEYAGRDSLPPVALARTSYAAYLAKGTLLPIYTAGGNPLHPESEAEGEIMYHWLIRMGISANDIRVEKTSNTTCESASLLGPILAADNVQTIVLVTSAVHIPRAMFCFSKPGIRVIAAPCAYLGDRMPYNLLSYLPQAQTFSDSSQALREYMGLLWYRLRY